MILDLPARAVVASLLLLVLAACGGGGQDASSSPSEPLPAQSDSEQDVATEDAGAAGSESESPAATDAEGPLTVYSGRNEELVQPVIDLFTEATGTEVEVRYGDTAELAALLLEEGDASPADVYFAQDAGALGAVADAGLLAPLPSDVTELVDERFRSTEDRWVGISGRARVIAYNTESTPEADVPTSVLDLTDPAYAGRVGWAPTNGSFQAFVTAMRVELGEDAAREWLEGMIANDTQVFDSNVAIVEAVGRGEIDLGLTNHYYRYRFVEEDPQFPVANSFPAGGDVGALVNVAGTGVVASTDQPATAEEFVSYLLGDEAQSYFAEETSEYPLTGSGEPPEDAPPLDEIETPEVDLADLDDLEGTLILLREVGALT